MMKFFTKALALTALSLGALFAGPSAHAVTISGCTSSQKSQLNGAITTVKANLSALKSSIQSQTGHRMGSTWSSQWDNAVITCTSSSIFCGATTAAYAIPGTQLVYICDKDSNSYIRKLFDFFSDSDDRRACLADLLAHEFTHNGFGIESKADDVGAATATFWIRSIGGTRSIRSENDCGFVD